MQGEASRTPSPGHLSSGRRLHVDNNDAADYSYRRMQHDNGEEDLLLPPALPPPPPADKFYVVYFIFYLLGMGTLLPWNFVISVNSFWDYKFRDVNATAGSGSRSAYFGLDATVLTEEESQTELQKEFYSFVSIASNAPNATLVILNAVFGQNFRLTYRILIPLGMIILFFFVILALAKVDSDSWQRPFLFFTLVVVVLINCCTAIFQGGIFGVAGMFPASYMGAVMAGQAMGGIFPALVGIIVVSERVSETDVGFYSFLVATLVLIVSFASFAYMRKLDYFRHYAYPVEEEEEEAATTTATATDHHHHHHHHTTLAVVLRKTWPYCLSVFLVFSITLSAFPALLVLVESSTASPTTSSPWADRYFTPVTCFLLFNCGDYAGRLLSSCFKRPGTSRRGRHTVLALSLARALFIPAFLYCNASPLKRHLPVLIDSDWAYVALVVLFSVSNGYLGNLCMILGPKVSATDGDFQEKAAMVLVACLVMGTAAGSFLSYLVISAL